MEPLLPGIAGPEDLKKLPSGQLEQLCAELRDYIITSVSRSGGHLGASLGVIELTVALHRIFSTPRKVNPLLTRSGSRSGGVAKP